MNKKGISLAELLAVIVIMGIVAGIATPLIGPILEKQDSMQIEQDAKAILKALDTYCSVNPDDEICYKESGAYNPSVNLKDYNNFIKIAPYCTIDIYKQTNSNTSYYYAIDVFIDTYTLEQKNYEYFTITLSCDLNNTPSVHEENETISNYSLVS